MEILDFIDTEGWVLNSFYRNTWLRYEYPGSLLELCFDVQSSTMILRSLSDDPDFHWQYFFGIVPSIKDLKDVLRLTWFTYNSSKDSPSLFPPMEGSPK